MFFSVILYEQLHVFTLYWGALFPHINSSTTLHLEWSRWRDKLEKKLLKKFTHIWFTFLLEIFLSYKESLYDNMRKIPMSQGSKYYTCTMSGSIYVTYVSVIIAKFAFLPCSCMALEDIYLLLLWNLLFVHTVVFPTSSFL